MSDTPETQEAAERWRQGKINIFDEMARLERERDKAQALVAEMKQAIVWWAKAEAKEHLHRLDQAACERKTWLEAYEKMKRERDEAREVAENLVEYAHECLVRLESWGKGYDRYEREMETIREAIAGCQKWKEAAR